MASSKSFFGKRRGSTKNFTFTVFNGKQVTKEKAEQVKNPRTLAQMRNRMVLTTSSAAYAAMKEIVDHSFQGYTYGLQNMSRFQSVNNKLLRENIAAETPQFAYCEYGKAKLLPGAYKISEGDLSAIANPFTPIVVNNNSGLVYQLMSSGGAADLTADKIMAEHGLSVGDLVTTCTIAKEAASDEWHFIWVRLTFKKAGSEVITATNFVDYFEVESNYAFGTPTTESGVLFLPLKSSLFAEGSVVYCGFIRSALVNGVWKRSDSYISIPEDTDLVPSPGLAISTYPVGGSYILNGGDTDGYEAEASGDEPAP